MWVAVYEVATGALRSVASEGQVADPLPAGLAVRDISTDRPDLAAMRWDATLVDGEPVGFVAVTPSPVREISRRRFLGRKPVEHIVALTMVRLDPATPLQTRAMLETAEKMLDRITSVALDDAATQQFVPVATDVLIAIGLVDAADRAAYIADWLRDADPSELAGGAA